MKRHYSRLATNATRLLFLVGLLVNAQLAVCEVRHYPIKDSKFPASEAKIGWLDNERVIFHGYEFGKVGQPSPDDGHPMAETGLFIWDTRKDTVTKYWNIDGPVPLCVFRGQIFFTQKVKGKENTWLAVIGAFGKEEQRFVSGKLWINGFSCRESAHKPEWVKEDKHRRWALLEDHGYLDFGASARRDPSKAAPILLYRPGATSPVELPLTGEQVRIHVSYFEFADAYLLESQRKTTHAAPVWLLKPDGSLTKVLDAKGKSWERFGWDRFCLTKKGLFLSGGRGGYASVGTSGGYLLASVQETPIRLVAGTVMNEAVSPDGCKVAFVHVLHGQAGAESVRALREGKPGSRTLKVLDLCEGE
jgi:hypothetical protein